MTWLEHAGGLSLYVFATVVAALLLGVLARALLDHRSPERSPPGRIGLFLFEYVGNVALSELRQWGTVERRHVTQARRLMEQITREMEKRRVPPVEKERFLEDLRVAIRSEERLFANGAGWRENDRRFLESQRWGLAERFHTLLEDAPPEIVASLKAGFHAGSGPADTNQDAER